LPEQYAKRLDGLLQEINKLNPYKNEPTSLDLSKWIDVYKSIFVYGLMNSITNSIIKHTKENEIEKIPNILEYLSKPEIYKALLAIYILKYHSVAGNNKAESANEKLEQIKYLKASNDTQKYIESTQNYFQEVIKAINSSLQGASNCIEDTIERLFYVNEKNLDAVIGVKIINTLAELYKP
jgi:transcription elongation factor GreA-like protein